MSSIASRRGALSAAFTSIIVVFTAGSIGSLATFNNLVPWYASLNKPAFMPPNWIFGPVWTSLYILMALAFWRVLTRGADAAVTRPAVFWFLVQIALNALWSVVFFGVHSPMAGVAVIGLLLVAIGLTIVSFRRIDGVAALLLAPYLAWVSFASALNAAVWLLNG